MVQTVRGRSGLSGHAETGAAQNADYDVRISHEKHLHVV